MPGGVSSSCVGAPSSARSLLSLAPTSSMAGLSFDSVPTGEAAPLPVTEGSNGVDGGNGLLPALLAV